MMQYIFLKFLCMVMQFAATGKYPFMLMLHKRGDLSELPSFTEMMQWKTWDGHAGEEEESGGFFWQPVLITYTQLSRKFRACMSINFNGFKYALLSSLQC